MNLVVVKEKNDGGDLDLSISLSLRRHAHRPLAEHLLQYIWHKIGNTLRVSKSSSDWLNYTGFPCVSRSFVFHLKTKLLGCQTFLGHVWVNNSVAPNVKLKKKK